MTDNATPLQRLLFARGENGSESPPLAPNPAARHEPFALNDMQQAYWFGRGDGMDGQGAFQHYLEFKTKDFDPVRFNKALNLLIARHDMLHATILDDGTQKVLAEYPEVSVAIEDMRGLSPDERRTRCKVVADAMWRCVSDVTCWPQNEFRFSRFDDDGGGILHCKLDMWCLDGRSVHIFFEDLATFYLDPAHTLPELSVSFRDYLERVAEDEKSETYQRSLNYWRERVKTLPPPPMLPLARTGNEERNRTRAAGFSSREFRLSEEASAKITSLCARHGISLATFVAAVYAEVLKLWTGQERFTLNFPRFNRRLDWHPDVTSIIGEFASFTLLECDLASGKSFLEHAGAMQKQMWSDLEHGHVSGLKVLRELFARTGQAEMQAMPVVFTATPDRRGTGTSFEEAFDVFGENIDNRGSTPQVLMDCQYMLFNNALWVGWDTQDSAFPDGMLDDMFGAFCDALSRLSGSDAWESTIVAVTPERQLSVRDAQNDVPMPFEEKTCYSMFVRAARQHGERAAITSPDQTVSYSELLDMSGRLAWTLLSHGRQAGTEGRPVALLLERGWRQITAVMGCMAAGLPYIPLDPASPPERLAAILGAASPSLVITEPELKAILPHGTTSSLFDPLLSPEQNPAPDDWTPPGPNEDAPAYLIFTSGSTGIPKGVTIGHNALLNFVQFNIQLFSFGPGDTVFGVTALHHDISVFDVHTCLCAGAKLVTMPPDAVYRPDLWPDILLRERVTYWGSVPVFMEQLLTECEERSVTLPLRVVVLGGDWIAPEIHERLIRAAPDVTLYTMGGPTETTCWNVINKVQGLPPGWRSLPYGRPIANASYHILNEDLADVPDWVSGEMYCGGMPVCQSASLSPEENDRAFAVHPRTGERLYKTGDMGRFHPDGLIEILGRKDFQLNINGYRLDPCEVEQALMEHEDVSQAVAFLASPADGGQSLLAAAVVLCAKHPDQERRLADWSNRRLPAALRPRCWLFLDALPVSANGKIDRKALRASALKSRRDRFETQRTAQNPVEVFIAETWEDVLNKPVAGVNGSFFELGGDSLKAMRIFSRISEKLGVRFPLSQIFLTPTIEGLAAEVYAFIESKVRKTA